MKRGWIQTNENGAHEDVAPSTLADQVYMDEAQTVTVKEAIEQLAVEEPPVQCITDAELKGKLLTMLYPVGSVHISVNNVNPSTYLGGSWALTSQSRAMMGYNAGDGSFNAGGKTGGAASVSHGHTLTMNSSGAATSGSTTLTVAQMPSHAHAPWPRPFMSWPATGSGGQGGFGGWTSPSTAPVNMVDMNTTTYVGGGGGHTHSTPNHVHTGSVSTATLTNLPPYQVFFIWQRVA